MSAEAPLNPNYRPRRSLSRRLSEVFAKALYFSAGSLLSSPEQARRFLTEREYQVGLLEGSVISPRLAFPDPDSGAFTYEGAPGGQWQFYDPFRRETFPEAHTKYGVDETGTGMMALLYPSEIADHDADERTPLHLLNIFSYEHARTLDRVGIEEMLARQVLRSTSYAEAYASIGMDEFVEELERRHLADDQVYQVTPKGNTLVIVADPAGKPEPRDERAKETELLPGRFATT